mmetsp:Transcript_44162/g.108464  ORF Transcript_44162/g.108464 Transcript_44162/m.108464 type:complete len:495 (+) Transcript_44162:118-1602(+)
MENNNLAFLPGLASTFRPRGEMVDSLRRTPGPQGRLSAASKRSSAGASRSQTVQCAATVDQTNTPLEIWNDLLSNNAEYASGSAIPVVSRSTPTTRKTLADEGQAPPAIIVCCADSRVPPEVIFQKSIGELFVVRCAGNIVTDFSALGSVEFGVAALKAKLVVVLGHSKCGAVAAGVKSLADGGVSLPAPGATGGLRELVEYITQTAKELKEAQPNLAGDEQIESTVAYNAVKSANALRESPVLSQAIDSGEIMVVPAVYDLASGLVTEIPRTPTVMPEVLDGAGIWKDLQTRNVEFAKGMGRPLVVKSTPPARRFLATQGQRPRAIVVCCADSRVPPEVIFQQTIGELFIVRCAGNIVSDYSAMGSVEFGVSALKAPLVIVLGHSKCGAIAAGVSNLESNGGGLPAPGATGGLRELVEAVTVTAKELKDARPSVSGDDQVSTTIAYNALKSAKALRKSPVISSALENGSLTMVSAVYDLASGLVEEVPEDSFP